MIRRAVLAFLLCAAIAPLRLGAQSAEALIRSELDAMAVAWNASDLERHMAPYADSATMTGSEGLIRGRSAVRDLLALSFWKDGKPLQQLSFAEVEVRVLARRDVAVATGKFILTGGNRPVATGRFTTLWELRAGRWRILHDHSG